MVVMRETMLPPLPAEVPQGADGPGWVGEFVSRAAVERAVIGSGAGDGGRRFGGDDFAGFEGIEFEAAGLGCRPPVECGSRATPVSGGVRGAGMALFGFNGRAVRATAGRALCECARHEAAVWRCGRSSRRLVDRPADPEAGFGAADPVVMPGWWVVLSSAVISAVVFFVALVPIDRPGDGAAAAVEPAAGAAGTPSASATEPLRAAAAGAEARDWVGN
jgi:hypothetical protein